MSHVGLHNLIAALASAVAEAEQVVRVHQIRNLRSFFTDKNEPVTVDLHLPRDGADTASSGAALKVPLITLVNAGSMSISEMEIKFSAAIGEVSGESPAGGAAAGGMSFEASGAAEDTAASDNVGWSATPERFSVDVSSDTLKSNDTGAASVTLKVRQVDVPEGLARVINRLLHAL